MKEGIFGIAMWCVPLLGGFMWAQAGNAPLTRSLLPEWALLSASGAVAMAALVGWAQPQKQPLRHPVPAVKLWTLLGIASIAGTLTTFLVLPPFTILSVPPYMEHRLFDALFPALHFPILSLILIPLQELYFRGVSTEYWPRSICAPLHTTDMPFCTAIRTRYGKSTGLGTFADSRGMDLHHCPCTGWFFGSIFIL